MPFLDIGPDRYIVDRCDCGAPDGAHRQDCAYARSLSEAYAEARAVAAREPFDRNAYARAQRHE